MNEVNGRACAPRTPFGGAMHGVHGVPTLPDGACGVHGVHTLPDGACGVHGVHTLPVRKRLDHRGPLSIDVKGAWYFITICTKDHKPWVMDKPNGRACAPRTPNASSFDSIATVILQHAREYHEKGKWKLSLFLVMPDHLHFIVHVPSYDGVHGGGGVHGEHTLPRLIGNWKRWLVVHYGIHFQVNFWDTRLRDDAHFDEKFRYICRNPVRKQLCAMAREWPHVIAFDRSTGEELPHRNEGRL